MVNQLVHDAGEKICPTCSGKNYWNKDRFSDTPTWKDVKKHLEKKW